MPTASELVLSALQKLGVKGQGATLSPSEEAVGLSVLNSMLDSWSIESLMV